MQIMSNQPQRRNLMKKEFNKIILFIGLAVAIIGVWYMAIASELSFLMNAFSVPLIAAILAFTFVCTSKDSLKTVGYALSALLGAHGLRTIVLFDGYIRISEMITAVGFIIMSLATVCHLIMILLGLLGFVKKNRNNATADANGLCDELTHYKELLKDGILNEEEFAELKQKAMEGADQKAPTMDDLKKWKKLLDQQVINDEEFVAIKKNIFAK